MRVQPRAELVVAVEVEIILTIVVRVFQAQQTLAVAAGVHPQQQLALMAGQALLFCAIREHKGLQAAQLLLSAVTQSTHLLLQVIYRHD